MAKYFKLEELLYSKTSIEGGYQNSPSWEVVDNLKRLAEQVLDPLREEMGCPINVSSGFRCKKLNDAVKGSKGSQHMNGEAADIYCRDNKKLFDTAKRMMDEGRITVGQLIDEYNYSWVHISLPNVNHTNDVLHIKK